MSEDRGDMRDQNAGYELLRERERLEQRYPDLVTSYREFLRDYARFREVQEQFAERSQKPTLSRTPFGARLK
jgi:hypothetical protein